MDWDDVLAQMEFPDDPEAAFAKAQREVPLLMNELPENPLDNPAIAALQSLIYDETPEGSHILEMIPSGC